ncbi:MAG: Asp23/Gls24 family envelope stress response protein [Oscillospiraceae bacterium]|nr:Asp23/Gls24 family envelope stress response protein [Oscillospiraceae bacterium]
MAEMKEYVSQPQELGTIHISEEVIASIAGVAAAEVEGVSGIAGGRDLNDKSGSHKVSPARGVRLQVTEEGVTVELSITVSSVSAVRKVAEQVQDAVISSVRDMTGLTVNRVNVNVIGVTF